MRYMVDRAVRWHQGQLPRGDSPASYDLHVSGPRARKGIIVFFHTYACLFPEQGVYIAKNTEDWPGLTISERELRKTVMAAQAPHSRVIEQRALMNRELGRSTSSIHWKTAVSLAKYFELPVAFYAIGDTADNRRVVHLRTFLTASVELAIERFKTVTPRIEF